MGKFTLQDLYNDFMICRRLDVQPDRAKRHGDQLSKVTYASYPRDYYDFETLWQWVEELQDLVTVQRELVTCSNKQCYIADKLYRQLDEKATLLEQKAALLSEKMELLIERLVQYEVAFSAEFINDG
ncbi:hypothetical protein [Spirosoma litoris]